METVIKYARSLESKKEIDDRVGFAAWGDSIAIFPSYHKAKSLEDMKIPVALVAREATTVQTLKAIAKALAALDEL